ncbi:MAG TPA: hypothetical protein DDW65_13930 [Firmicutes bacterium]|jgi:hypothetical protein|nr:hypothetical protein [Bacillota bacterium]
MKATKYHWYERLFFNLQIRERKWWRLLLALGLLLILSQVLLSYPIVRKYFVLIERYEGQPATFYKSFNRGDL